ncbi:AbrB/MazE/SpoVT family DNA-binding domain-containing protein [Halobacillus massiliensis]|uniref:AbrB/MazE/SpoVT family DNA-binding domain-containing protein n=1 Tax=Halobacillus massiliensis TaxID=1926286 RepID=UPI0009E1E733|nr:AbrB/MazE/SpoVT family DNA-binding domain-containing protein [Halobacillus massiliensis]
MKSTGIVRKIDELGRIVIPMELRNMLTIDKKDPIEIFVDDDKVVMKKYHAARSCAITGEITEDNQEFEGGIWLSPAGMRILAEELDKTKVTN